MHAMVNISNSMNKFIILLIIKQMTQFPNNESAALLSTMFGMIYLSNITQNTEKKKEKKNVTGNVA